ncbi:hypothetical protein JCM10049v2_005747 [Rhodotorula toruloides]
MLALRSLRALRIAPSATRAYTTHPAKSGAQGSGNQGIGEDAADIQRKNAAVPVFVAAGAGLVGYIVYSQMSAKKEHEEANKERKTDMRQEKQARLCRLFAATSRAALRPRIAARRDRGVAGEKERMGGRG